MDKINLPGFTAEASVYESNRSYFGAPSVVTTTGNGLVSTALMVVVCDDYGNCVYDEGGGDDGTGDTGGGGGGEGSGGEGGGGGEGSGGDGDGINPCAPCFVICVLICRYVGETNCISRCYYECDC